MKTERTVEEIISKLDEEMKDILYFDFCEDCHNDFIDRIKSFLSDTKSEKMCRIGHDPVKCTMDIPGHEKDCPLAKALINNNGTKEECNYWTDKER